MVVQETGQEEDQRTLQIVRVPDWTICYRLTVSWSASYNLTLLILSSKQKLLFRQLTCIPPGTVAW